MGQGRDGDVGDKNVSSMRKEELSNAAYEALREADTLRGGVSSTQGQDVTVRCAEAICHELSRLRKTIEELLKSSRP